MQPILPILACTLFALALQGGQPLMKPPAGARETPPYTPASTTGAALLASEARWIRNQVWTTGDVADASTYLFPRSFDVTSGYGFMASDYFTWMLEHNDAYCQYDLDHNDHTLDVPANSTNDAAVERVMMAWGADAYDMACWSVAMGAAARNTLLPAADRLDFGYALRAYHHFLTTSAYPGGFQNYRAYNTGGGPHWKYGEAGTDAAYGTDPSGAPRDSRNAFVWQFPAPRWQNPDPHYDPLASPTAVMNWPQWGVITGEEAWAVFLGPMQVAWNQGGGHPGWSTLTAPVDAPALLENACRALGAVELMQNSATGGLYRVAVPMDAPDPAQGFDVSTENNWSMYAGLGFLEQGLVDFKAATPGYKAVLPYDLDLSLAAVRRIRGRMAAFFLDKARVWHDRGAPFGEPAAVDHAFFLQGTTGEAGAAAGNTAAFATDVQTWGIAAILGDRDLEGKLEGVYGPDFLFEMFRAAVEVGGYYTPGHALAGIGFGTQAPGAPTALLSGEWTWGAINAAIVLADFHREPAHAEPRKVDQLLAWARSMLTGVTRLCSHDYRAGGRDWVGFLYANDRRFIPWGWFANPCPSQAATAWAFQVNAGFNPFEAGGGDHQATAKGLGLAGGS